MQKKDSFPTTSCLYRGCEKSHLKTFMGIAQTDLPGLEIVLPWEYIGIIQLILNAFRVYPSNQQII